MKKFILTVTILLIFAGIAFATNFVKENKVIFEGHCIDDSTLQRKCTDNVNLCHRHSQSIRKY